MTERKLETTRGVVHYWISRQPNAPALFFLHGLGANHLMFGPQIEVFARAFTVIAWDAPCCGASRPYSDSNMLHCATELRRILDAEHIERCVLIGHGLGGMTAQTFIDHWPERALGFVGIDTCPMDRSYYSKRDLARIERPGKLAKLLPFGCLHALLARRDSRTAHGRALMRRMLADYDRRELCMLIRRSGRSLLYALPDAQPIRCAKLLLLGEHDRVGQARTLCRKWREREGVPLYRIRGAGHIANVDNPRSTNRLIGAFLNSLR